VGASPATSAVAANAADGGRADAGALSAEARASLLRHLRDGRKASSAKDWGGALKAFDQALAIAPDDARVLSEVGWAAFQANDLARAEAANKRALANTKDPKLRAATLYNSGRVAEARGQKDAATKLYRASLELRDNAEVKKRLAGIGAAPASSVEAAAALVCREGAGNLDALCKCLLGHPDELMTLLEKPTCKKAPAAPMLHGNLSVVEWGSDGGERAHLLVVREGERFRPVAELGRDYEPGAFGVHNSAEVKGGELKTVNGHTVVVVRSEQHNSDSNMAGLELCIDDEKIETVCAVDATVGSTRCAQVPVEVESGCGLGVDPGDVSDLDDETKQLVANLKKAGPHRRTKAAWSLADDGKLTVRIVEGARDLLPASALEPRALW
jgi:tetratricopeptide (TPR) repeat protein